MSMMDVFKTWYVPMLLAGLALLFLATSAARPRYTNSWAVEVRGGPEIGNLLARKHGFINHGQVGNLKDIYHFSLAEHIGPKALIEHQPHKTLALQTEGNVGFVEQQVIKRRVKKGYVPPTDPNWGNQWSLLNTGQTNGPSGLDLNVEPAWIQGITGRGVVVAFVDDGLEWRHPDLSHNYDPRASWDFAENDADPTPDYSADNTSEPNSHGTSCAGEVGMEKDNGRCGVGVAYDCHIGGLKLDLETSTDLIEANALGYKKNYIHVYSNSWGPSDNGFIVDKPGSLAQAALETAAREGRNGNGSIFIFAAGNGGEYYDSCAADGYSGSIYTISIGSADQTNHQADYDEKCSAKMAVTFSYNSDTFPSYYDGWDAYNQITTVTIHGRCTDGFTGTSASTPLVAGVIALTLQANPNLSWRDVQYLIAYTSNRELKPSSAWTTNGAGLKVSPNFGFGAIDAEAMVTRARRWISVPEQHVYTIQPIVPSKNRTASHDQPIILAFQVSEQDFSASNRIQFLEHVVVQMTLTVQGYATGYNYYDYYEYQYGDHQTAKSVEHPAGEEKVKAITKRDIYDWLENAHTKRGDIKMELWSPHGTRSTLLPYRKYDFINEIGYDNWPFMSLHYWGESPTGTWTLKIYFKSTTGSVHMSHLSVILYGTAVIPEAVSNIPSQCDPTCARGCSGLGPENCDACLEFRVASTLECVTECPQGTYQYKKYCLLCDSQHENSSRCQALPTPSPASAVGSQSYQQATQTAVASKKSRSFSSALLPKETPSPRSHSASLQTSMRTREMQTPITPQSSLITTRVSATTLTVLHPTNTEPGASQKSAAASTHATTSTLASQQQFEGSSATLISPVIASTKSRAVPPQSPNIYLTSQSTKTREPQTPMRPATTPSSGFPTGTPQNQEQGSLQHSSRHKAAIIGGTVGGVILLLLLAIVIGTSVAFYQKVWRKRASINVKFIPLENVGVPLEDVSTL